MNTKPREELPKCNLNNRQNEKEDTQRITTLSEVERSEIQNILDSTIKREILTLQDSTGDEAIEQLSLMFNQDGIGLMIQKNTGHFTYAIPESITPNSLRYISDPSDDPRNLGTVWKTSAIKEITIQNNLATIHTQKSTYNLYCVRKIQS